MAFLENVVSPVTGMAFQDVPDDESHARFPPLRRMAPSVYPTYALLPELGNLLEIKTMLAETVIEWTEQWKQQGMQQGMQQGIQNDNRPPNVELRFALPTYVFLKNATTEQLEHWAENILDAKTMLWRHAILIAGAAMTGCFDEGFEPHGAVVLALQPIVGELPIDH